MNRLASADVAFDHPSESDSQESLREHLERLRENLGQLLDGTQLWQDFLSERRLDPPDEHNVLRFMKLRASRARCFGEDLFHDPAWDILLDLYAARLGGRRLSVSDACIGSQAPPTTGLRWLTVLEQRGLIVREADCHDGRRVYVFLTDKAVSAMQAFFKLVIESRV